MLPLTFKLKSPVEQFMEYIEAHQREHGRRPAAVQVGLEDLATFRKDPRVQGWCKDTLLLYGVLLVPAS